MTRVRVEATVPQFNRPNQNVLSDSQWLNVDFFDSITEATTTSQLKITGLNLYRGPCTGKTEIYMLCDKVQKGTGVFFCFWKVIVSSNGRDTGEKIKMLDMHWNPYDLEQSESVSPDVKQILP